MSTQDQQSVTLNLPWWEVALILSGAAVLHSTIGFLLARRARAGALIVLVITLYPPAFALVTRRPLVGVWVMVGLALLASIWPQLSQRSEPTRAM